MVTLGARDIAGIVRQHFLVELDEGVGSEFPVSQGCKGLPSAPRLSGYRAVLDRILQGQAEGT